MRAFLEVELPPGAWLEGCEGNRFELPLNQRIWIGRSAGNDLRVHGLMFGGQKNCGIILRADGTAVLFHAGHALGIDVDGERLGPHEDARVLRHGSTFSPEGDKPGLRFRLVVVPGG